MPSDASKVGSAIVAKLAASAPLLAALPDGVYRNEAPPGKTKFAIVNLQHGEFNYVQPGSIAYFDGTYLVKAVMLTTSVAAAMAAAQLIFDVLQDAALSIAGYAPMVVQITEQIEYSDVDENTDLRWQHIGGLYQVMAQPS